MGDLQHRSDEVRSREATVEVSAREVDVTLLGRCDDSAVRARHASGKVLSDSAATVAKTELLAANANNAAVVGARSALAVGGSGVVGWLRGSRRSGSWGRGLRRRWSGLSSR